VNLTPTSELPRLEVCGPLPDVTLRAVVDVGSINPEDNNFGPPSYEFVAELWNGVLAGTEAPASVKRWAEEIARRCNEFDTLTRERDEARRQLAEAREALKEIADPIAALPALIAELAACRAMAKGMVKHLRELGMEDEHFEAVLPEAAAYLAALDNQEADHE